MSTNYTCDECLEPVEDEFSALCDSCSADDSELLNITATITWRAFGEPTSATVTLNAGCEVPDEMVCELLFHATNTRSGSAWEKVQAVLPENRTHTALSVGDTVTVNGTTYRCASVGWEATEQENN